MYIQRQQVNKGCHGSDLTRPCKYTPKKTKERRKKIRTRNGMFIGRQREEIGLKEVTRDRMNRERGKMVLLCGEVEGIVMR